MSMSKEEALNELIQIMSKLEDEKVLDLLEKIFSFSQIGILQQIVSEEIKMFKFNSH